jgi:hypothetical protein
VYCKVAVPAIRFSAWVSLLLPDGESIQSVHTCIHACIAQVEIGTTTQ